MSNPRVLVLALIAGGLLAGSALTSVAGRLFGQSALPEGTDIDAVTTRAIQRMLPTGLTFAGPGYFPGSGAGPSTVFSSPNFSIPVSVTVMPLNGSSIDLIVDDAAGTATGIHGPGDPLKGITVMRSFFFPGLMNLEMSCAGPRPCAAVWRIDSRPSDGPATGYFGPGDPLKGITVLYR